VDTLAHKIPNFIDKYRRPGAKRVFIVMENVNLGGAAQTYLFQEHRLEKLRHGRAA
jgi:hypothetical protein